MTKYETEYEDAPSGSVTFYNYKEPLMKFDNGYGYVGALVFDSETEKVQCHLCGDWLGQLPHHLHREHNMSASAYKDKVGLLQSTALISESMRAKLIASGLDKRLQNLRAGGKKTEEQKEKIRQTLIENGNKPENMNKLGTCPAQLIDRLKKVYEREGENFLFKKHIGFDKTIIKTYGSVEEACRIAGIPYRTSGKTLKWEKHPAVKKEEAFEFMREYFTRFAVFPRRKDFVKQGKKTLYDYTLRGKNKLYRELKSKVLGSQDNYVKSEERLYYSKEDLLEFLRKFEKINGRKPSISDGKRCLIPYPSRYIYHFGSWKNAMDLAFN
jgi:sulfur relay (sulfurtransferase) DsrC/TusE family protein